MAMIMWNFIAVHSLSKTTTELAQAKLHSESTENVTQEFTKIKSEIAGLQKKAKVIEKIDSKINVANVLAEISFLVDKKIVLSKVEFIAEKFDGNQGGNLNNRSTVRVVAGNLNSKESLLVGDVRFKILINGVASDAGSVAELICKLEDSPYFCQVIPLFTRNKDMKTTINTDGEKFQISEFAISCNLANYQQQKPYVEEKQKRKVAGL